MSREELTQIMQRIAEYYDKFIVNPSKVMAWYRLFKDYSYSIMTDAVDEYAMNNSYAPVPDKLKSTYFNLIEQRKAVAMEQLRQQRETGEVCKYCNGTGWFYTLTGKNLLERDVAPCKCQGDPSSLNKALACPAVKWSDKHSAFIPLREWVGEERQQKQAAAMPVLDFKNVGKSF